MEWQSLKTSECAARLKTDIGNGLTERQAEQRLREYGRNEIEKAKRKSIFARFISQFSDFMVIILLIAAAVSFITSCLGGEGDMTDSVIILAIVTVDAVIGVVQESKAEKAIDMLKNMSAPHASVIRGGHEKKIKASELVPGDIVTVREGDFVPADLRLTGCVNLKAEESALTGESLPADKNSDAVCAENTPLGDRADMLYSSSSIVSGHGQGIVVETGMDTQVGKIARLIVSQSAPQTPLQRKLAAIGKKLGIGALIICFVIFIMGLFQQVKPLDMLLISISLAVAAIPEGLPAVVTITLAMGVRRMAAQRAIVRRLPAVETLGGASVICTDKTGTLTQNRMSVQELADGSGRIAAGSDKGLKLLQMAAACTNCVNQDGVPSGDPTETAIVRASHTDIDTLRKKYPRVLEIPFSSERKMMTVVCRMPGGHYRAIAKGAPDVLSAHCLNGLESQNQRMAARALRVLGIAYRDFDSIPADKAQAERGLTFYGLIGMSDPPRPEAAEAVRLCKKAGIRPVMITGDHAETAAAIAKQLKIAENGSCVLTGKELDVMGDAELKKNIYKYSVFARVSPEHKVRIVRAFQSHGEVVAMTGDGVNDAPALRAADIGCAMGKSGTDVARAASDMILTDDNFATIVSAVREGRGIYENIKKTVHFLISCNIGEILTIFVGFLLHMPSPLLAIQLLWVNLVTDSFPALALGVEPIENDIMEKRPVRSSEKIFGPGMVYSIAVEGALIGSLSLLAYSIGRVFYDADPASPVVGRTMAFAVLSLSQIVHTFNMRSERSVFAKNIPQNPKLILAAFVCVFLQAAVIVIRPLGVVFKTAALTGRQWLTVTLLSLMPLLVVELEKAFARRKKHVPRVKKRNPA